MNLKCYLFALLFLSSSIRASHEFISVHQYVDQYKDIAIAEMQRTGIPASIKIGQAILESNHGNSDLSRNSNNHFGIKCKQEWEGNKYYHKDDDRDKKGRLIKSCFRVYDSVFDSYIDHSNFLMSRERYAPLFENSSTDYKAWAHGLKKCGYATAKHYAEKLIKIIESNELYTLDFRNIQTDLATLYGNENAMIFGAQKLSLSDAKPLSQKPLKPVIKDQISLADEEEILEKIYGKSYFPKKHAYKGVFLINSLRAVALKDGQTLHSVADKYDISVAKLKKYNDIEDDQPLLRGQYIFLMPKAHEFNQFDYHKVKEGETLYMIAQFYGIQLDKLQKRNAAILHQPLKAGVMVKLNGKPLKPSVEGVKVRKIAN